MLRLIAGALALATALAASVFAQAAATGPTLTPVWNLTTGFASPESAFYDAASNALCRPV